MVRGEDKGTIDTVQVALRIRPLMPQEVERGCDECIDVVVGEPQVQIKDLAFTYNFVFPQHITQQEFYDTAVKGLIGKLFEGYNVTILAYGQTGSGKTYTMGTSYTGSDGDSAKLGVIPQAVSDIFDFIETNKDKFEFKVNVSFMELYQEQCFDLLSGKAREHSIIEIREDVNRGVILPGITELPVSSIMETMMALARGSILRVTGSTAMNHASSRSHAVFTIIIAKESLTEKNLTTTSKFHLVDLAGSERIKKTKASGERLREGVKINQGLLALGNVISALGDGTNRSFISYRDSKLTRLLQDSLGGNSLTLMVACVSPADYNLDETVSTLRYADRARRIRNKPVINQDAKAAEIIMLKKIVNELRLQLIEKVPTVTEQNTEQLELQLEKERNKYAELLKKHKQITEHLANVLTGNTNLCEKAMLAEVAKDSIEKKLNELIEQCNQTLENFNTLERSQDDEHQKTTVVDYIKQIITRLKDLQSVNWKIDQDIINHEIKILLDNHSVHASNGEEDEGVLVDEVDDETAAEEEKRVMRQVLLNKELQTLNREMAIKASSIQDSLVDNKEMFDNCKNLRENEEKIAHLEKERDELMQQLKQTKTKDPAQEERRFKVCTLESEISDLKERMQQQQAHIIKMTVKNEDEIASLDAELQAMKSDKFRIIKQMREESEKFRKWKADIERAMAKKDYQHAKQHYVLKRKVEETVSVSKRLKEALERQKVTQMELNAKGNVQVGTAQAYIEQELEVHLSLAEAEKSLELLMDYRALIIDQIEYLRNKSDGNVNQEEIAKLEEDLAFRKAQISDLQQKILTADQENKSCTLWDNIQMVLEAKVAIKCLFNMLVDAKRELQNQSEKGYREIKEAHDRLAEDFDNARSEFRRQIELVKIPNEPKLKALVSLHCGVVVRDDCNEACKQLQNVIQTLQEQLNAVEEENKKLVEEVEQLRSANYNSTSRPKKKKTVKVVEYKTLKDLDITDENDLGDEDDKDPDWRCTPLFKRLKKEEQMGNGATFQRNKSVRTRHTINFTDKASSASLATTHAVKRRSDGSTHCACRGSCSTKICGCMKVDKGCGASCRCSSELCRNRRATFDSEDKENQPSGAEFPLNSTPNSSFDKRNLDTDLPT